MRAGCGLLIVTDTEFTDMSANMVKTPQSETAVRKKNQMLMMFPFTPTNNSSPLSGSYTDGYNTNG